MQKKDLAQSSGVHSKLPGEGRQASKECHKISAKGMAVALTKAEVQSHSRWKGEGRAAGEAGISEGDFLVLDFSSFSFPEKKEKPADEGRSGEGLA